MSRAKILCLFGGLVFFLGMSTDGCQGLPGIGLDSRQPPVIVPSTPPGATFSRTFSVDLRGYPETNTVTWDFGDGSAMPNLSLNMGRSVAHQYSHGGTFNVLVHLFDAADPFSGKRAEKIATGSLPVTVNGPNQSPIPAFVFDEAVDDEGAGISLSKRFDASNSRDPDGSIVRYEWSFGDGESDIGRTLDHSFPRSGRFPVRLTVTDNQGAKEDISRTVLVNSLPTASFSFEETSSDGLTFNFDAGGSSDEDGQLVLFSWDFDDRSTETGQVVSHTFAEPGDFEVKLTVTDEFGASNSTIQTLDVTGVEVFIRSLTPAIGEVDTEVTDIEIDGENFESGAAVTFIGGQTLFGRNIRVESRNRLLFDLDLEGAPLGDYKVSVLNLDGSTDDLEDGFRVVTPDRVRLVTSMGEILFDLVEDAPITTENFLQYVEDGFYNGTIFHRVRPGFVVQGGGFLPGMVRPEGLRPPIENEFSRDRSNLRGTVAMAKVEGNPDSATSQFFVNLADNSQNLDNQNGGFTVFANVIEGMDVVDDIAAVPLNGEVPVTDVVLIRAERE